MYLYIYSTIETIWKWLSRTCTATISIQYTIAYGLGRKCVVQGRFESRKFFHHTCVLRLSVLFMWVCASYTENEKNENTPCACELWMVGYGKSIVKLCVRVKIKWNGSTLFRPLLESRLIVRAPMLTLRLWCLNCCFDFVLWFECVVATHEFQKKRCNIFFWDGGGNFCPSWSMHRVTHENIISITNLRFLRRRTDHSLLGTFQFNASSHFSQITTYFFSSLLQSTDRRMHFICPFGQFNCEHQVNQFQFFFSSIQWMNDNSKRIGNWRFANWGFWARWN